MVERKETLPSGWETKYDMRTGRWYFINHNTKSTTFEDPRSAKSRSNASEYIPLQHGSPDHVRRNTVYPSQPTPMPAFQAPGHYSKYIPLQDMKNGIKSSPLVTRRSVRTQESSFAQFNTEESVAKVSAMFPTASETHIRILLKKYHNREAVVISALQVEKHPLTTPGPFATPPPSRGFHAAATAAVVVAGCGSASSRTASPVFRLGGGGGSSTNASTYSGSPKGGGLISCRPHSSPKLKLRYMKSVFPDADETIILEVLSNHDNNIQKTTDQLRILGYAKKDTVKLSKKVLDGKTESTESKKDDKDDVKTAQPPASKYASPADKATMMDNIKTKFTNIPEQVITIALESVEFDETRAYQILQIMQDETKTQEGNSTALEVTDIIEVPAVSTSHSRQSLKSIFKNKDKNRYSRAMDDPTNRSSYGMNDEVYPTSPYLSQPMGANSSFARGPNDKLLLEDYVKWQGPDRNIVQGHDPSLAHGPNQDLLLQNRFYKARGSNPTLRIGPKYGLAKGSIFASLSADCRGQ